MPTNRPIAPHFAAALALCFFASLSLLAQSSAPWTAKDWHEWSKADCEKVLKSSPWAKTILARPTDDSEVVAFTVQLISALPIRQALAREWQIDNYYDLMMVEQQRAADRRITEQVGQSYDDRIVLRVIADATTVPRPKDMSRVSYADSLPAIVLPGGNKLYPRHQTEPDVNSRDQAFFDATMQRLRGGKPLIEPTDKILNIQLLFGFGLSGIIEFKFNLKDMTYVGKLEF